jgi:hypothetical protein
MKKTILAYILSCIEEIPNDFDLGAQIRTLQDVLEQESDKDKSDVLIQMLFVYTVIYSNDFQLGYEIRKIYNELKYFFDGCTTDTHTDSN